MKPIAYFLTAIFLTLLNPVASALDILSPQTANTLVQQLLNDPQACLAGSSVSQCQYHGATEAAAVFNQGTSSGLDIDSGIVLSTGKTQDASGPNLSGGKTTNFNSAGDSDLNNLTTTGSSYDAAVLEFDFLAQGSNLSFQYLLASEEYNEFVNSNFNDVFGFFLHDIANPTQKINLTNISINSINKTSNSTEFVNNDYNDFANQVAPFAIEYDGFTRLQTATTALTAGNQYHLKLAVADVRDSSFDSAVFLRGFSTIPAEIQIFDGATDLVSGSSLVDFGSTPENQPLTKTLRVQNSAGLGAADLNLSQLTLPAGFSLQNANALPTLLASAASLDLIVQLDANNAGQFSGNLQLDNNDPDENPFQLSLQGSVISTVPKLTVLNSNGQALNSDVDNLNFASLPSGGSQTLLISLQNTGTADLVLSNSSLPAAYQLVNFPQTPITPGGTSRFGVQFSPTTIGQFSGRLQFQSNDPAMPLFRLFVTGQAVAPVPTVNNPAASIPTLSEWAMILLSLLVLGLGMRKVREIS